MRYRLALIALALPAAAACAVADEPALTLTPASINLQPEPQPPAVEAGASQDAEGASGATIDTTSSLNAAPAGVEFGDPKSKWWSIGAGAASNGTDVDLNLYGRFEYFIAKDIELMGELGGWTYAQEDKDAVAVNTSLVLRYHWFNNGRTTIFVDGGIGLLFSNDPVNRSGANEGTVFNFTPRMGGGVTHQLTDDGVRLEVGLRWAHVSNARIGGANDNPGRDSAMIYAGLIFPF